MTICGIKLTHDGAIALIEDSQLIFCYECEKLHNARRHCDFTLTLKDVGDLLREYGHSFSTVDRFVIDGWGEVSTLPVSEGKIYPMTSRLTGASAPISVSGYGHLFTNEDLLDRSEFRLAGSDLQYSSYLHVAGHVFSAYCTSPFAQCGAGSFILVWDGVMAPQLFHYDPKEKRVSNCGALFPLLGSIYAQFPHDYPPFSDEPLNMGIPGKAMAYVALGSLVPSIRQELHSLFERVRHETEGLAMTPLLVAIVTKRFLSLAKQYSVRRSIAPADMIANFHYFVEDLLLDSLRRRIKECGVADDNLCFSGGSALNIKWNTALRECGAFKDVWVPPFPNDSGSAIGTACCELIRTSQNPALSWSVYSGPSPSVAYVSGESWSRSECSIAELAAVLHETGEPVVFMDGPAELGPRALGHRSILASPTDIRTKQVLNDIKARESYRPVAPVCLEEDAPDVFSPGSPDPYMLFEHRVREPWADRIPAVCHLDGTARLQTVSYQQNPTLYELLRSYKGLSGVPVLCNTSANHLGRGFFPDVESAMNWGRTNYIWSGGYLYTKTNLRPRNRTELGSEALAPLG